MNIPLNFSYSFMCIVYYKSYDKDFVVFLKAYVILFYSISVLAIYSELFFKNFIPNLPPLSYLDIRQRVSNKLQ